VVLVVGTRTLVPEAVVFLGRVEAAVDGRREQAAADDDAQPPPLHDIRGVDFGFLAQAVVRRVEQVPADGQISAGPPVRGFADDDFVVFRGAVARPAAVFTTRRAGAATTNKPPSKHNTG